MPEVQLIFFWGGYASLLGLSDGDVSGNELSVGKDKTDDNNDNDEDENNGSEVLLNQLQDEYLRCLYPKSHLCPSAVGVLFSNSVYLLDRTSLKFYDFFTVCRSNVCEITKKEFRELQESKWSRR
nr:hypothetical protein CFP56_56810 [Quercus suber]